MNEPEYLAFTTKYPALSLRLINMVSVCNDASAVNVKALWDTGATGTCISTRIAQALNLTPTGMQRISTPSGFKDVNTYLVDIILPNNVKIIGLRVCDSDIGDQGIDALIGMDIITKGDLLINNYDGVTSFSFRTPSKKETDFVTHLKIEKMARQGHKKKSK